MCKAKSPHTTLRLRNCTGELNPRTKNGTVKSFHEVKAIIEFRGGSKMELIFLVSDRSGRPLFFNIFWEGINMLLAERTEIGAMLDQRRGDLKALISDLKKLG